MYVYIVTIIFLGGIGLAAPQVGESVRIAVFHVPAGRIGASHFPLCLFSFSLSLFCLMQIFIVFILGKHIPKISDGFVAYNAEMVFPEPDDKIEVPSLPFPPPHPSPPLLPLSFPPPPLPLLIHAVAFHVCCLDVGGLLVDTWLPWPHEAV